MTHRARFTLAAIATVGGMLLPLLGHADASTRSRGTPSPLIGHIIGSSLVVYATPGMVELTAAPGVAMKDFHPEQDMKDARLLALVPGWHPLLSASQGGAVSTHVVHPDLSETDHLANQWSGSLQSGSGNEQFAADCTDTIDWTSDGIQCNGSAYASYSSRNNGMALSYALTVNGLSVAFQFPPPSVGVSIQGNTLTDSTIGTCSPCYLGISAHATGFWVTSVSMQVQAKVQVNNSTYPFQPISASGGF